VTGLAQVLSMLEPAKLMFSFDGAPPASGPNYQVIDTDYQCSALIYSCAVISGKKYEFSWILSRQRMLSSMIVDDYKRKISSYGVDSNKFEATDQSRCYN
jgi:lipocalin